MIRSVCWQCSAHGRRTGTPTFAQRVLALLEPLKDDASTMVRRSVANNLNDLGKVRPDLLIRTAAEWLKDGSPERRSLAEPHGETSQTA